MPYRECEVCSIYGEKCAPVQFGDDAKACVGTRTCSAQSCHRVDVNRLSRAGGVDQSLRGVHVFAQTFTSLSTGKLIEFRLRSSYDCATTIALQGVTPEGRPDGVEIARSTSSMGNFVFSGVPISAGQKLAFVLTDADCIVTLTYPNDTYADGEALMETDGQWQTLEGSLSFMTVYE